MAKYHINKDGKIMPCKALLNACPYSQNAHADTQEALYAEAFLITKSLKVPEKLIKIYNTPGGYIEDLSLIGPEISKSDTPIESMLVSLRFASNIMKNRKIEVPVTLTTSEQETYDELVTYASYTYRYPDQNSSTYNWVPKEVMTEAYLKWHSDGEPYGDNTMVAKEDRVFVHTKYNQNDMLEIKDRFMAVWKKKNTKQYLSNEKQKEAVKKLDDKFNELSGKYNLSKLISQPYIARIDEDNLADPPPHMNTDELLSLYDDYTISDQYIYEEVRDRFNNFNYRYDPSLPLNVNQKLEEWYNQCNDKYQRYKLETSRKVLVSLKIINELRNRKIDFGDVTSKAYDLKEDMTEKW